MKIIVEGEPKEIAALVQDLQERRTITSIEELEPDNLGVKLCADDVLENE